MIKTTLSREDGSKIYEQLWTGWENDTEFFRVMVSDVVEAWVIGHPDVPVIVGEKLLLTVERINETND